MRISKTLTLEIYLDNYDDGGFIFRETESNETDPYEVEFYTAFIPERDIPIMEYLEKQVEKLFQTQGKKLEVES